VRYLLPFLIVCAAACSSPSAAPVAATPVSTTSVPATTTVPAPTGPPTITITATGMQPLELTIAVGQKVLWINNDVRPHDVVGGVDPLHPDCPEILSFLSPGQRGETAVFTTAKTCDYHDHTALGIPGFGGKIIIR